MSVCGIVNNPSVASGWTSQPINYYGSYTTFYSPYQATLSTSFILSDVALITLTMLCMTTKPSDFTIGLVSEDGFKVLSEPSCPINLTGNITSTLGYYEKGPVTLILPIGVEPDQPSSEWLNISEIWIEACYNPPESPLWWIMCLIVVPIVTITIACILLCYRGRRPKFSPLEQIN